MQTFGHAAEPDAARSQVVYDGEDVLRVATEPIQLPDGQHVAFAEVIEAGVKLGAAGR